MPKLTPEERAELEAKLAADNDDEDNEDFGEIAILRGPGVKKFLEGLIGTPKAPEGTKPPEPTKDPKPPTKHKFFAV